MDDTLRMLGIYRYDINRAGEIVANAFERFGIDETAVDYWQDVEDELREVFDLDSPTNSIIEVMFSTAAFELKRCAGVSDGDIGYEVNGSASWFAVNDEEF